MNTRSAPPTADEVRAELSAWLDESWDEQLAVGEWWARLARAGWASPALPVEAGGRGFGRSLVNVWSATLADHGVMGPPAGVGRMLAAPTIAEHGSPEQIERFVPRILDGRDSWCQLFSEPAAGSDLAGLQCKAERDGDEWVITGQKVWTSGGHVAQWGMLLARTDPDAPKHRGITYFAFPMNQPGVEVRPLRESTGRTLFDEVFIDEARVAHADVIGDLNGGWSVANATLAFERAGLGTSAKAPVTAIPGPLAGALERPVTAFRDTSKSGGLPKVGHGLWETLVGLARQRGLDTDPVLRDRLTQLFVLVEIDRLNKLRSRGSRDRMQGDANLGKLAMSELYRQFREVGLTVVGADGMLAGHDERELRDLAELVIFSPAPAIYGGTDEIQRNIVGERVLGLPREPGVPKETPFRDLPKN